MKYNEEGWDLTASEFVERLSDFYYRFNLKPITQKSRANRWNKSREELNQNIKELIQILR